MSRFRLHGTCRPAVHSFIWLGPVVLGWSGLAALSHGDAFWTVVWTNRLFGWMAALTYFLVLVWALAINRAKPLVLFRWGAVNLSIILCWLALDLLGILNLINWQPVFWRLAAGDTINSKYETGFVTDPELEFRRPPNIRWSGRAAGDIEQAWSVPPVLPRSLTFNYDPWGYRNRTSMNHADVALIGDSFVEGWYVSDEETVAQILQNKLGLPVANLGVAGYGSMQEFLVLKKESARLKPSLIVWFFFEGNDLYDDFRFERSVDYLSSRPRKQHVLGPRPEQRQLWPRSFSCNLLRALRRWSNPVIPNRVPYFGFLASSPHGRQRVYFADYPTVPWSDWMADRWTRTQASLEQGTTLCRESGVHLLLCYVPVKFRVYQKFVEFPPDSPCRRWSVWPLPKLFADFCRAKKIPWLDLTEVLQQSVQAGGMPYAPVDSHWGPEGHALVAKLIHEEIQRRGWLPVNQAK